ncbi:MAG: putative toxin-antitoxin system toxin component, PIN family [Gammaproteobacteria bacterium]|nr:putative toxin-antitoxin system toxin component, PIN family [Gammaproteobacteria bacterium]
MANNKRFVFDTNVLISAALSSNTTPAKAFDHALKLGRIVLCQETFDELVSRLLRPKFDRYITRERRMEILDDLLAFCHWVSATGSLRVCRDKDDDKFIEAAINADAGIVVSGDQDLLVIGEYQGVKIVNPREFCKLWEPDKH